MLRHKEMSPRLMAAGFVTLVAILLGAGTPEEEDPRRGVPAPARELPFLNDQSRQLILDAKRVLRRDPTVARVRLQWGRMFEHHEAQLMEARALELALGLAPDELSAERVRQLADQAEREYRRGELDQRRLELDRLLDDLHQLELRTSRP